MAGAVSAGAFTAGVMDYLLETLDLWEKAKAKNRSLGKAHPDYDFSVPMHQVEIDVISGSSAGGITGTLAMLTAVDADYQPVNKDNPQGANNRFYQSWVVMGDDAQSTTFAKMLQSEDLKALQKGEKPKALLNSLPIDVLAENALQVRNFRSYPPYISKSLDLVLTTTNLRGINFKVDFGGSDKSGPVITSHAGFFRYKLFNESFRVGLPQTDELYQVLDLRNAKDMQQLKDATLSTAAFPIGLPSREVELKQEYINRFSKYYFGDRKGIYPLLKEEESYKFNSIDGGLINNEPFGVALKVLHEKYPALRKKNQQDEQPELNSSGSYAVIMIDPFPNKDNEVEQVNPKADILTVAKGMFMSLRNQAMFNQDGILDALELVDRTKFLIEPIRKEWRDGQLQRAENDLASAPFSGFAGFMNQDFRAHDFQLGRKNAQTFFRYYFGIPEKDLHNKLDEVPEQAAFERFFVNENPQDISSARIFPILPDMRVLHARNNSYDLAQYGQDAHITYPDYPQMSKDDFDAKYHKAIKRRVELLANTLQPSWWFAVANRLYIRGKVASILEKMIVDELYKARLLK